MFFPDTTSFARFRDGAVGLAVDPNLPSTKISEKVKNAGNSSSLLSVGVVE